MGQSEWSKVHAQPAGKLLPTQLDRHGSIFRNDQPHGFDIFAVELSLLSLAHVGSSDCAGILQNVIDIEIHRLPNGVFDFIEDRLDSDGVTVPGTEIIHMAVGDPGVLHSPLDGWATLDFFHKDKKACLRHRGDEAPVVGITGRKDEGVSMILEELPAGARGKSNIDQGLALFNPIHHNMLNWNLSELIEDLPAGGGVDVIIQNDFDNLVQKGRLVQIIQCGIQLVWVYILTIHHNGSSLALLKELIHSALGHIACIRDFAQVVKAVEVDFVEEGDEFLIVV